MTRLSPVFLDHGRSKHVELAIKDAPGCLTVVVLGAQSAEFSVAPPSPDPDEPSAILPHDHPPIDPEETGLRSSFGAASLHRCGSKQNEIASFVVNMRSQRGAVEIITARSPGLLGDLREALPERAFGPVAPRGDPGRPLEPGPLADRTVRAEERARIDGAQKIQRLPTIATPQGGGEIPLRLGEGCHRVEVMAAVPPTFPHRSTDVDAEVQDAEGRVLARDRSESPDARLDFCLGEPSRVSVPFGGAAGMVPVIAVDATFAIPPAVPNHWGARTRAGFALALQRRHAPAPPTKPVFESLGVVGQTMVPVPVEPGRCYLAAVAVARGEPRGLRVAATIGDRYVKDEVSDKPEGAVVAFCAEGEESARIDVDARGNGVWWTLALFPLGGSEL